MAFTGEALCRKRYKGGVLESLCRTHDEGWTSALAVANVLIPMRLHACNASSLSQCLRSST